MTPRHTLSVIVIAKDEADRLGPCLESVRDLADEIVVLDASSADGTADIAREYTDRVVVTSDWPGDGIQKQRALDAATGDWVLRIDADERVSPDLRSEIEAVLARDTIEESAFRIRWATWVFGRYLTHGECGVAHLNLFRREGASYTPAVVHARLVPAPGPIGRLRGRLLHHSHRSFRHMIRKLNDYACFDAAERAARGERASIPEAYLRAAWRFFRVYVLRLGFLDGWRGLLLAGVYSHYVFTKHAALWAERFPALPGEEAKGGGRAAAASHRDVLQDAQGVPQDEARIRPAGKGEPGTGSSAPESGSTA